MKVLVVDSKAADSGSARYMLKFLGHQVLEAESQSKAQQLIARFNPEVMFVSAQLQNEAPLGVARQLREEFKYVHLIVVLTMGHIGLTPESLRIGAADVLVKPLKLGRLAQAFTYLEGSQLST